MPEVCSGVKRVVRNYPDLSMAYGWGGAKRSEFWRAPRCCRQNLPHSSFCDAQNTIMEIRCPQAKLAQKYYDVGIRASARAQGEWAIDASPKGDYARASLVGRRRCVSVRC